MHTTVEPIVPIIVQVHPLVTHHANSMGWMGALITVIATLAAIAVVFGVATWIGDRF